MSFKKNDRFVRGSNHQNIRVAHHRRRVDWIGDGGKTFEQICKPPSEYLDQPRRNLHPRVHLQYDIDRGFIEQISGETQVDRIVKALGELGGSAPLKDVYEKVNSYTQTPEPSIRKVIYLHSSECDIYEDKNKDLFYAPEGKGKGVWALRDHRINIFPFKEGIKQKRTKVHKALGGSGQGGINPTNSGNILLFSDPKLGETYGYHDGWVEDVYMYYGEGQRGDMEFSRGNKSVLEHKETGNRIRLFMGAKGEVTYESQFETDEEKPFELIEDLDIEGKERVAIVFRLRAVRPYKTHLPETNIRVTEKTTVEAVDVESFNTDGFEIGGTGRREGVRKESKLMSQYIKYRKDNEQPPLESRKIKVAGEAVNSSLRVDGWVEQDKLLIEAKSSCTRHQVRLAIGQLFDYKRYLDPKRMAILLPSKPKTDLIELIKSLGIELIYKTKGKEFKEIK